MSTHAPETFLDEDKSLACIHCGLCLSSCPTYLATGNENNSPRGRIYLMRAMQQGRQPLNETTVRPIDLCLGCRACEAVCPSGVQYGDLLEHTRDHIERHHRRPLFQTVLRRVAIEKVFPFPKRMKMALLPARMIKGAGAERLLPKFARDALALLPDQLSCEPLPEYSPATGQRRGTVAFVSGCVMSVMFGDTNRASVKLLNQAGYDVWIPSGQGCCGALHAHNGKLDQARDAARANIAVFEQHNVDAIIINAAGCGSTLKEYGSLLRHDPEWSHRANDFSAKVKDLTEWLAAGLEKKSAQPDFPSKVTYHDACHLAHAQRVTRQPRDLVRAIAGNQFIEMPESDLCCGSAGTYNLTEPEMAGRLQARKIANILKSGAEIVVTSNPGCLLQIQSGLRKAGVTGIKAMHIADFLEAFNDGNK